MTIGRKGLRAPQAPAHTRNPICDRGVDHRPGVRWLRKSRTAPLQPQAPTPQRPSRRDCTHRAAGSRAGERPFPNPSTASRPPPKHLSADPDEGLGPRLPSPRARSAMWSTRPSAHCTRSSPPPRRNWWRNSSADSTTTRRPHPRSAPLRWPAGRLVFQDRSVSYLRCAGEAPAPPVELAEPIEAPPATTPAERTPPASGESDVTTAHCQFNAAGLSGGLSPSGRAGSVTLDALVLTTGGVSDVRIARAVVPRRSIRPR